LSQLSYCYIKLNRLYKNTNDLLPIQEKIILLREEIFERHGLKGNVIHTLAIDYGNMARYLLFHNDFIKSIYYCNKVLDLNPKEEWIYTDLVRAYIMIDRFDLAEDIYNKMKNRQYPERLTTYKDEFLTTLDDLQGVGIYHINFEQARALLNRNDYRG
jgi:pentatricopeptide repeat protein